ncbi:MAG TPA: PAS domain-containing protein [Nannocystis sp.]|jgi:rsbT co-antagonist protein RsbR
MPAEPATDAAPADALAASEARAARLEQQVRVMQGVLDALPYGLFWKDLELVYRGCNKLGFAATGLSGSEREKFLGRTDFDMWQREQAEAFTADDREVLARREAKPHIVEAVRDATGATRWVETFKAPVFDAAGELLGVVGTFRDISEQKQAEQASAAEQREAMLRISTPLLPVADGVVVLPLIGELDPERAEQVMHTLLSGVAEHRATTAILDITGLHTIDATAAEALVRAARAIRLLGAEAIVTGVRPAVAQTLVALGAELGDLVVLGDLKAGIRHALARRAGRSD